MFLCISGNTGENGASTLFLFRSQGADVVLRSEPNLNIRQIAFSISEQRHSVVKP